jgi:hypothetical protein
MYDKPTPVKIVLPTLPHSGRHGEIMGCAGAWDNQETTRRGR